MRTLLITLHSKYIHPSLALPCLAAYCGTDCGAIEIVELTVHQPKENLLAEIVAQHADVVCFSVYIWNRQLTLELVAALRLATPATRIVLGGPEISFEAAAFFDSHPVAALICGEGEIPLRQLLSAWQDGLSPSPCAGLQLPGQSSAEVGVSQLASLDHLPSPFVAGLVDLSRGYVYYESSRGCPYSCSFCMSALESQVRSFSAARIEQDLGYLMAQQVAQIKFVDRTFNFNGQRSREIIQFILENNRSSRFHFEIGADLLDAATLELLQTVPAGIFQFEIGVQTTSLETLKRIHRTSTLQRLKVNVQRLLKMGNIHLHLDLIAGLPGESAADFYASLGEILDLKPDHLQVELVKLLPGAPLRAEAVSAGIQFDPAPPYSVLRTATLDFIQLEEIRRVGRLLDLLGNSGRFGHFLERIALEDDGLLGFYRQLQGWWHTAGLFKQPLNLQQQFFALNNYLASLPETARLREALARDFALAGRVVPGKAPVFFDTALTASEERRVKERVKAELDRLEPAGKLQHFATVYGSLSPQGRSLALYLYRGRSGESLRCEELLLD